MDFDHYQRVAASTAVYPGKGEIAGLSYTALGLNGEAGEVAEKVKKLLRDGDGEITPVKAAEIAMELGDVLWYVARAASELGYSLDSIAMFNVEKLQDRKDRGVLQGSGDNR